MRNGPKRTVKRAVSEGGTARSAECSELYRAACAPVRGNGANAGEGGDGGSGLTVAAFALGQHAPAGPPAPEAVSLPALHPAPILSKSVTIYVGTTHRIHPYSYQKRTYKHILYLFFLLINLFFIISWRKYSSPYYHN